MWDTTIVVLGDISKYIATARRSGQEWFLGVIGSNDGRTLDIPLGCLDTGRDYFASLYTDGGEQVQTGTHVRIDRCLVRSTSIIMTNLEPSGGMALEIRLASEQDLHMSKPYNRPPFSPR